MIEEYDVERSLFVCEEAVLEAIVQISKDDYERALLMDEVRTTQNMQVLRLLYDAPNHQTTARELGARLGYPSYQPANSGVGRLGHCIADVLGLEAPSSEGRSRDWWRVIADGEHGPDGFVWTLKAELAEAFVDVEPLVDRLYPEMVSQPSTLVEGACRRVSVNSYDRNMAAREACIERYGAVCMVCGFDFEQTYGSIGAGFIHVHHVKEISSIGQDYCVDPITDLRPVCPNCHAMLHQRKPAFTLEELRASLEKSGNRA